ncbi:hypothetical protein M408DRAFT_243116 [Serendipita vermifera MAFF 305830]|uniref:Uncharacterized protein n=1 Tax=Serendipita vermifera MAFF 305830 TaxID=933852 RepID=A0A0C2X4F6_SERVB|nr:hypothetical protein M408DRAFT_243116 [Serendipita vermifera MAFF 305830]
MEFVLAFIFLVRKTRILLEEGDDSHWTSHRWLRHVSFCKDCVSSGKLAEARLLYRAGLYDGICSLGAEWKLG